MAWHARKKISESIEIKSRRSKTGSNWIQLDQSGSNW